MVVLGLVSTTVFAADFTRGKELHQENCISCHVSIMGGDGSGIYTRSDRQIESLDMLRKQVKRCKTSLQEDWPEDQVEDVIYYLNQTFYKF